MTRVKVPTRVTVAQVQAATEALGITWNDLYRLELEGLHGIATHFRRGPDGLTVNADNNIATTTRTFAIRDDTRTQKRANARDRIRRARWTR